MTIKLFKKGVTLTAGQWVNFESYMKNNICTRPMLITSVTKQSVMVVSELEDIDGSKKNKAKVQHRICLRQQIRVYGRSGALD